MLSGVFLPELWVLIHDGSGEGPRIQFTSVQWHAHEMFFGFGWAVLGGFLLTASKNWVRIRGYSGYALIVLAVAWLMERLGMWYEGVLPKPLFLISNYLFILLAASMLVWTLIHNRKNDTYSDNYFFVAILPLFLLAKYLMLSNDHYLIGWSMVLGLFRMAFLVMLERTLTQFMKAAYQVAIYNNANLNSSIKFLGLLLVFESLLPPKISAGVGMLLAILLAGRFVRWSPKLAFRRIDVGIMYLGYVAITAQLVIEALRLTLFSDWQVSVSIHFFTFGAMGLIVPAMLIRIVKGHTGRKVAFDHYDKIVLWVMIAAFMFRIVAPEMYPTIYARWLAISAACWAGAFSTLAWRYIPFLLAPRIDGKAH
jgi:uncharacterized protein involved in response to NO